MIPLFCWFNGAEGKCGGACSQRRRPVGTCEFSRVGWSGALALWYEEAGDRRTFGSGRLRFCVQGTEWQTGKEGVKSCLRGNVPHVPVMGCLPAPKRFSASSIGSACPR